jgi:diadenosine tetraphosphate (Ap4A) HIT family hydrolase
MRSYDSSNIFARILRGEIPSPRVHDARHAVAIKDIHPQAPTHLLVLPTGAYVDFDDFAARASDEEIVNYVRALGTIAREAGIADSGYRVIFNVGPDSHQEVPHLHAHILGGRALGPLVKKIDG